MFGCIPQETRSFRPSYSGTRLILPVAMNALSCMLRLCLQVALLAVAQSIEQCEGTGKAASAVLRQLPTISIATVGGLCIICLSLSLSLSLSVWLCVRMFMYVRVCVCVFVCSRACCWATLLQLFFLVCVFVCFSCLLGR